MRAVLVNEFGPIENAALAEIPEPAPGPGDVLIETHAAAVNYADLLVIAGEYQFRPHLPFVPGKGAAGIVAAVGGAAGRFKPGDRVFAWVEEGGWAERVAAPAALCRHLPEQMPFVDAAAFGLDYATAWFALEDRARLMPGETVLVLGASGAVGFAAVQLAKALGARVLAGIATPEKRDLAEAAGADAVIELWRPDLRESLRAQVREATAGAGADIILDPVGGDVFEAAIRALAWRGRLVVIGFASGRIPTVRANYLLLKNIEVSGLQVSDYKKYRPQEVERCFAELFALYDAGRLKPLVMAAYPLARFAEGLRQVQHRTVRRKIVLTPITGESDG
jgi:NADPH:quinone reductase